MKLIKWLLNLRCILLMYACLTATQNSRQAEAQSLSVPQRPLSQQVVFRAQHYSLAQCAAELSAKIGRGIMVDDEPQIKGADFDFHGTAAEALDELAKTFDYSWTVSKHGAVLMHKQFRTPDEYPQLNVPELQQAAQDALAILSHYPADFNAAEYVAQLTAFYHSLTPGQLQVLHAGKPIYARELNAAQFDVVQRLIASSLFGEASKVWNNFGKRLNTPFSAMPHAYFNLRPVTANYQEFAPNAAPAPVADKSAVFEFVYTGKAGAQMKIPLVVMPGKKTGRKPEEESRHVPAPL